MVHSCVARWCFVSCKKCSAASTLTAAFVVVAVILVFESNVGLQRWIDKYPAGAYRLHWTITDPQYVLCAVIAESLRATSKHYFSRIEEPAAPPSSNMRNTPQPTMMLMIKINTDNIIMILNREDATTPAMCQHFECGVYLCFFWVLGLKSLGLGGSAHIDPAWNFEVSS